MATQLDLPLRIHTAHLAHFLDQLKVYDDQMALLRDARKALIADARRLLPVQAILVALKIVDQQRALEERADQPMKRAHQTQLQDLIERWREGLPIAKDEPPAVPDMVTVEVAG